MRWNAVRRPGLLVVLTTLALWGATPGGCQAAGDTPATDRLALAREILAETPLVDGHNDLPSVLHRRYGGDLEALDLAAGTHDLDRPLHTDIPRLRAGLVGGQFWAVWIPHGPGPEAVFQALDQIDIVHRMVARYPEDLEIAHTAADVRRIHAAGRIASIVALEGGHAIGNSLAVLRQMYNLGVRYLTLTHNVTLDWIDAATDRPRHGGLSEFGREVIAEMNRLGMLVDLSHVSHDAMHEVLNVSAAPVIFSHSSAYALCRHARNVPDDVLERLPANGGLVMVTFVPSFVSEELRVWVADRQAEHARARELHLGDEAAAEDRLAAWQQANPPPRATLEQVADHIDHVRAVAGIEHVGIGSDFDGIWATPVGLEDVSTFPALLAELLRRGYTREEAAMVAGGNLLRVMEEAEKVAAALATSPRKGKTEQ